MTFDDELREIIKYQVEGRKGQINPKDDFVGFIFDIKGLIGKYLLEEKIKEELEDILNNTIYYRFQAQNKLMNFDNIQDLAQLIIEYFKKNLTKI